MRKLVRKDVDFDTKAVDEDGSFFTFEGMASTFDRDLVGDIIEPGAFVDTVQRAKDRAQARGKKALIPALFNHDMNKPIGRFVELSETADGLFAKGELPKSSKLVSETIMPMMDAEVIASMSIGFFVDERRFEGDTRFIEKLSLVETSLVTFPANPEAAVTSFKSSRLTVEDLGDMNLRDIERHFLEGNPVSRKMARKISTLLKGAQRDADEPGQWDAGESEVEDRNLKGRLLELYHSLARCPNGRRTCEARRPC